MPRVDPAPADAAPARSGQPYRERLLAGMADLCAAAPRAREPQARERLGAVFLRVLDLADLDTRRRFAERVADAEWVSPELALRLGKDRAEVAEPVLGASPALGEPELRHVLEVGSAEHRAAVARRADLPPRTAQAVLDTGEPLALAALAGNVAAELPPPVLRGLVDASERLVALRAPLARRADLGAPLARRLAGWVGPDLHAELARRFTLDGDVGAVADGGAEARLVDKLGAAGQLKPGFLLRTLREGRLSLFEAGLCALGGFSRAQVATALRSERPELLALACAAVGVDRSVTPTILELVRSLNGGAPRGEAPEASAHDPSTAAAEFRARAEGP